MNQVAVTISQKSDMLASRAASLRLSILQTHATAGQGHLGSSLSIVEILTALFASGLDTSGWTVNSPRGDRLVLSKGHAALALYCALARDGLLDPSALKTFGRNGSALEPHPNERVLPAVQVSTGSLGQGLSVGLGLAHGSRMAGEDERCFVVLGDGELNEGQPWEAAIAAVRLKLGNLVAIVDANGMQQDGFMEDVMPVRNLAESWTALGWMGREVDGHDVEALVEALKEARLVSSCSQPKLIVARTLKARGVPFMENTVESHFPTPLTDGEIALVTGAGSQETWHV